MRNNSLAKFTLTALAAFAISACGSSGGGDNNEAAPANDQAQNQPTTAVEQPAQPSTPTEQPAQPSTSVEQPVQPSQPTVSVEQPAQPATPVEPQPTAPTNSQIDTNTVGFSIPKSGGNLQELTFKSSPSNVNIVNVEGKAIEIVPTGFSAKIVDLNAKNLTRYVGGNNQNIRWGLVTDDTLNNRYLLAYGVNPTTNMPSSGTVSYVGNGVHAYSANGGRVNTWTPTEANLRANFSDKSLTGELKPTDNTNAVEISAKIDGNKFSGTTSKGTEAAGGFYGNNASELAGSYINTNEGYVGVFGAQKQ